MSNNRGLAPYLVLVAGLAASAATFGQGIASQSGADVLADWQEFERLVADGDRKADLNRDGKVDTFDALVFLEKMQGGGAGVDTWTPTLYFCIGNHWQDSVATPGVAWSTPHDFGPTAMNYRVLSQDDLRIRGAKHYPSSPPLGTHNAWAKVDPGTSTYELHFNSEDPGQDAFDAWVTAVLANMETSFEDDPLSSGRMIELDNESLMFLGWYWGRFMQATFYDPPTAYADEAHVDAHTAEFMDWGVDFMDALQSDPDYDEDLFGWYNLPVHRNQVPETTGHPWDGDAYLSHYVPTAPDGTFPWWSVDEELRPLLEQANYVDAKLYNDHPVAAHRDDWWEGQMERGLAIVDDLAGNSRPYLARIWIHDPTAFSRLRSEAYIEAFFTKATLTEVEHAGVGGGRSYFEGAAALAGQTPGQLWNTLVVANAEDAGFAGSPVDQLTLVSATPDSGALSSSVTVSLWGSDLDGNTSVSVSGSGISVGTPTVVSDTELQVTLTISSNTSTDFRDITVTRGGDSWTVEDAFKVYDSTSESAPAPIGFYDSNGALQDDTVGPGELEQGVTAVTVRLAGRHFQSGCAVTAAPLQGTGVSFGTVTFIDSTRIEVPVTVTGVATTGDWTLRVTNPDSQYAQDWKLTIKAVP